MLVSSQAGSLRIHVKRHSEDETKRWSRVFHENMFLMKKLAQPTLQVFGGFFEGTQKDF